MYCDHLITSIIHVTNSAFKREIQKHYSASKHLKFTEENLNIDLKFQIQENSLISASYVCFGQHKTYIKYL